MQIENIVHQVNRRPRVIMAEVIPTATEGDIKDFSSTEDYIEIAALWSDGFQVWEEGAGDQIDSSESIIIVFL